MEKIRTIDLSEVWEKHSYHCEQLDSMLDQMIEDEQKVISRIAKPLRTYFIVYIVGIILVPIFIGFEYMQVIYSLGLGMLAGAFYVQLYFIHRHSLEVSRKFLINYVLWQLHEKEKTEAKND